MPLGDWTPPPREWLDEPEPVWYVIGTSLGVAEAYAVIDHDRTGTGQGWPVGPRPWMYVSEPYQLRGRTFTEDQVHWTSSLHHPFRTGAVDEFEAIIASRTRA